MNTLTTRFRKEVLGDGKREEVYLYYSGRLIYKQWYVNGVKVASRMFYDGEGLTQFAKCEP